MNSTSFGEKGGSFALVFGGKFLLGWPGAPGCTTLGCWAEAENDNKVAARNADAHIAKDDTTRSIKFIQNGTDCIRDQ
jgi:hypothetical protein